MGAVRKFLTVFMLPLYLVSNCSFTLAQDQSPSAARTEPLQSEQPQAEAEPLQSEQPQAQAEPLQSEQPQAAPSYVRSSSPERLLDQQQSSQLQPGYQAHPGYQAQPGYQQTLPAEQEPSYRLPPYMPSYGSYPPPEPVPQPGYNPYGGASVPYGGAPGAYGRSSPTYGGAPAAYSGAPAAYGGAPAAYSGAPAAYGGAPAAYGGAPAAYSGAPAAYSGAPAAYGGAPAAYGGAPMAYGGATVYASPSYPQSPSYQSYGGQYQPVSSRAPVTYAPQGLIVPLCLTTAISTQVAKAGDFVQATVSQNVSLGGLAYIPAGTVITGSITEAEAGRRLSRSGALSIQFNQMRLPDGNQIPISAHLLGNIGRYKDVGKGSSDLYRGEGWGTKLGQFALRGGLGAGLGAGLGTAVGAIAGGGHGAGTGAWSGAAIGGGIGAMDMLLRKGKDVLIPSGTAMQLQLDAPVAIAGPQRPEPPKQYPSEPSVQSGVL